MYRTMLMLLVAVAIAAAAGCTGQSKPSTKPTDDHAGHGVAADKHDHGQSGHAAGSAAELMISTKPPQVRAGEAAALSLMLHDATGKMLKAFDVTHEKLAHLILIREGLDEFAHVHPEVDALGNITIEYTFTKAGKYHVFLDYQPKGGTAATAHQQINVEGEALAAPALEVNVPGDVPVDGLTAKVDLKPGSESAVVTFDLRQSDGAAVTDLEPYLGAMGHLVVVSADGAKYVHAHPLTETSGSSAVKFEVHFPAPGLYKLWGQFLRGGQVVTVPAVVEYQAPEGSHQHSKG